MKIVSMMLIVAVTLLTYAASGRYGIVSCDDYFYVTLARQITDGLSFEGVRWAFGDVSQSIWMPLTWISYMLDYTMGWGYGGMHLQSVAWQAANGVLLFLVLRALVGGRARGWIPLTVALAWAVHPLRVESVVWIASRKDVISTFFFLLGLLFWIRGRGWHTALSLLLIGVGALAKPSVMVFPLFAFAVDFLVTGRRRHWCAYAMALVMAGAISVEASWAQWQGGAMLAYEEIPFAYRIVNAVAALSVYIHNTLWPTQLAMQCMLRYPAWPRFSPDGLLLLGLTAAFAVGRFRKPVADAVSVVRERGLAGVLAWPRIDFRAPIAAGLLVFLLAFIPFLGLVGFGVHSLADRFTILPSVGLSVALAFALERMDEAFAERRIVRCALPVLALTCVVALAGRAARQTTYWRDDFALMEHTLEVDGEMNPFVHRSLAISYWELRHDYEKVYRHLVSARQGARELQLDQLLASTHFLVEAAYETGRKQEAEEYYFWMRKRNYQLHGEASSFELLVAEAIYEANRGRLVRADAILDDLRKSWPTHYGVLALAHYLATRKGDPDAIERARLDCLKATGDPFCRNRWALIVPNL